jgi:hypothetical protein
MELQKNFYVGVVEDNKDPNRKGRIKVRVQTLYHSIPVEDIPYAHPFASLSGKEFQIPAIGKLVNILFLSDDLYSPYYIYSENYNVNLQNKLDKLSERDYIDFFALLFDEKTQIFVEGKELTIDQLLNKITINNNTINLELKDDEQILNLGSRNSDQDAVLGTRYFEWMDKFIDELSSPYSLIGNNGAPIIKAKLQILCQEYKLLRPDFVSKNVKIVDNGEIIKLSRNPETNNSKNDIDLILPLEEDPVNIKRLEESIMEENEFSCQVLEEATPSDIKPLPPRTTDPNLIRTTEEMTKVWSSDAQNKIETLHPEIRPYAVAFLNKCQSVGIKLQITDAYRSFEQQSQYILEGKPAAQPGKSYHNYGLAIDVQPINSYNWDMIGKIGESLGFRWGKHFKNPKSEPWHFDWGRIAPNTNELLKRQQKGDLIDGYVRLSKKSTPPTNTYSGQEYVATKPSMEQRKEEMCIKMDEFNGKNDSKIKSNTNNQADENEPAPSPELEKLSNVNVPCKDTIAKNLLDKIASGEGTTDAIARRNGYDNAYEITYAYGKYTPEYVGSKKINPITKLTIGEIKQVQQLMIQKQKSLNLSLVSSAMGKYQIISKTLLEAQNKLKISNDTPFSEQVQDQIGIYLLKIRGFDRWIEGKITDDQFQENLSKEWASIASPKTGKSYYNQPVGTTDSSIKLALNTAKKDLQSCA